MYLLFLDESGTPPSKEKAEGKFFVIGGVIIHHTQFNEIYSQFELIKAEYEVKGEVKWSYFGERNNTKGNSILHLTREKKDEFRNRLYDLILSINDLQLCASVVECSLVYESYDYIKTPQDIYHDSYWTVAQIFRVSFIQQYLNGEQSYGMVFSDHRNSNTEDKPLRAFHHEIVDVIDEEYNVRNNPIIGSLHFIESELSPLLQLSDLVAGAVLAKYQSGNSHHYDKIASKFIINTDMPSIIEKIRTLSSGGEA